MSVLNPTTFLDLVQRFAVDVGAVTDPAAQLPTIVGATGQALTFSGYINQAWKEIQLIHADWTFLRNSTSFTTVAAQTTYTAAQAGVVAGSVGQWSRESFRVYLTASGFPSEQRMTWLDYDDWRDTFLFGSLRTAQVQPLYIAATPSLGLAIPCPLPGYTIIGDYYASPVGLTADAEIPSLPSQFIMLIIYRATMAYAEFESAPEVFAQGKRGYDLLFNKLESSRLIEIRAAGALA